MVKKIISIGLIGLFLIGAISCGGAETKEEQIPTGIPASTPSPTPTPTLKPTPTATATPTPTPTPRPTPAPKPETTKPQRITGTVTLPPEAKGKIEVTHRLTRGFKESSVFPEPEIEIEIKNISNEPVSISDEREPQEYDTFFFKVISKDKEGKVLEERIVGVGLFGLKKVLQPKEITSAKVSLFSSDETRSYEIIGEYMVSYKKWLEIRIKEIQGKYVSNPKLIEVEKKLNITHRLEVEKDAIGWHARNFLLLIIEVENIGNEPITPVGYLYLEVVKYEDAEGSEAYGWPTEITIATRAKPLNPGEKKSYTLDIYAEKVKSYKISLGSR